jgi:hypothetical protein
METFEHLGFLLQLSEGTYLSQGASFFANSDPDMPAAPVPASLVHDWILQHIASTLEFMAEHLILMSQCLMLSRIQEFIAVHRLELLPQIILDITEIQHLWRVCPKLLLSNKHLI